MGWTDQLESFDQGLAMWAWTDLHTSQAQQEILPVAFLQVAFVLDLEMLIEVQPSFLSYGLADSSFLTTPLPLFPGLVPVCEKKLSLYTDRWWTGRRNMWTISGLTGGGMMPAVPPTNLAKSPAFLDGFGAATISATVLFLRFTAGGLPIALAAEGQSAKEPSIAACPLEGVTAEGLLRGACPIVISGIAGSSKHCMPAST